MLKPATASTGIVAGGAVRAVIELAGIHNIVAKSLGRGNPFNVVLATLEGLNRLRDPEEVVRVRRSPGSLTPDVHRCAADVTTEGIAADAEDYINEESDWHSAVGPD